MAEEIKAGANGAAAPSLSMINQYIKDLSFENPKAPDSLLGNTTAPKLNINVSVAANKKADDIYSVELTVTAQADRDDSVLFNAELVYGGVFKISNFPDNQLHAVVMIECPKLLFPFARQVLATTTQTGGFMPLMLDPIDFAAIYTQNLKAQAAQANKTKQ